MFDVFGRSRGALFAAASSVALISTMAPAFAQEEARRFDIPAQPLAQALITFSNQAERMVVADPAMVNGRQAPALHGDYRPSEALDLLLAGSGLAATSDGERAFVVATVTSPTQLGAESRAASSEDGEADLVVTGTRIRGAPSTAPVIRLSQDDMRTQGSTDLGQAMRALPQNFNGGQNPGVSSNVGGANGNGNGAVHPNLRGLGSDATLTLVNGRRLAYNAQLQGVDISAIPLAAVDRMEVVADGSSALYGTDAVGGVINVMLMRDYEGLSATARFGASTDGGNEQQQYEIVTGNRWESGGFVASFSAQDYTAIYAGQREYGTNMHPSQMLLQPTEGWSSVLSGHQRLGETFELSVDALYHQRDMLSIGAFDVNTPASVYGSVARAETEMFSVATNLAFELPSDWRGNFALTHGQDTIEQSGNFFFMGYIPLVPTSRENIARGVELNGEGPIFSAPGGPARLAVGVGQRETELDFQAIAVLTMNPVQETNYAYGELYVPLATRGEGLFGLDRLALTLAARYEDYPGIEEVLVPKIGLALAPSQDLEFRVNWGESFKAPVLARLYQGETPILYAATTAGASGFPANATVLVRTGGNTELTPEYATTWTFDAIFTPRALPGARFEVSYFNVEYSDKVVTPITSITNSLLNPLYASFINLAPTAALVSDIVANSVDTLQNASGQVYDPANVVAIIDRRFMNAAEVFAEGIDVNLAYEFDLGAYGTLDANIAGTYLTREQRLLAGQPLIEQTGRLYDSPSVRARAGATWRIGEFTLAPQINYTGELTDFRYTPRRPIDDQFTYDLTARYNLRSDLAGLRDVSFTASVLNLTNEAPPRVTQPIADYPYDSTNYGAVGRFVSFAITSRW